LWRQWWEAINMPKVGIHKPKKKFSSKVPELIKTQIKAGADTLVEKVLKPKYIELAPKSNDFNYLVDIFTKWYGNYFYFCSRYNCPSLRALSPSFEDKFARLEYGGPDIFSLAFKRHTGQWVEIYSELSLEECLHEIEEGTYFIP
jgi:hypothetical protein